MAPLTAVTSRSKMATAPMTSIATDTIIAMGRLIVLTPLILPEVRSFSKCAGLFDEWRTFAGKRVYPLPFQWNQHQLMSRDS